MLVVEPVIGEIDDADGFPVVGDVSAATIDDVGYLEEGGLIAICGENHYLVETATNN